MLQKIKTRATFCQFSHFFLRCHMEWRFYKAVSPKLIVLLVWNFLCPKFRLSCFHSWNYGGTGLFPSEQQLLKHVIPFYVVFLDCHVWKAITWVILKKISWFWLKSYISMSLNSNLNTSHLHCILLEIYQLKLGRKTIFRQLQHLIANVWQHEPISNQNCFKEHIIVYLVYKNECGATAHCQVMNL